MLLYYAFTSLSTVGFGDFHPKNSYERVVCIIILGFGVATFAGFISTFMNIVLELSDAAIYDEYDSLERFMQTIKVFNNQNYLPDDLQKQIYSYFKFRWDHDSNFAI